MRADPLVVYGRQLCPQCRVDGLEYDRPVPGKVGRRWRKVRKGCQVCKGVGFQRADLQNLWAPRPGFLVGGGPSLASMDTDRLKDRGVCSLGINNVAGAVPVRAQTFGDPQVKFHHGLFFDPAMMVFVPTGKLMYGLRAKLPDGTFRGLDVQVWQCPNVWGYARSTTFDASTFLTCEHGHWGQSAKAVAPELGGRRRITTMLLGLRLMHYLGCPRVYLIGVDFYSPRNGAYLFPEVTNPGNRGYDKITAMLEEAKPYMDAADFKVYNCNPASHCEVFDHVPFGLALADCRGPVPREPWDLAGWYPKSTEAEWKQQEKAMRKAGIPPMLLDELAAIQEAAHA